MISTYNPWVTTGDEIVNQLPQRVETLLATIGADALDRLHLVEHQDEPLTPGMAQDLEQPAKKPRRPAIIDFTLEPRFALRFGADIGLPHQPSDQPFPNGVLAVHARRMDPPQRRCKLRLCRTHTRQPLFQQITHRLRHSRRIFGIDLASTEDLLLQIEEPPLDDRPKRALGGLNGLQRLDGAAVHRLHAVERRVRLADLNQRRGKARVARALLEPASEEGLARPIIATHRLEAAAPGGSRLQLIVDRLRERLEPHRKQLQPAPRHSADPQRIDDLATLERAHGS